MSKKKKKKNILFPLCISQYVSAPNMTAVVDGP